MPAQDLPSLRSAGGQPRAEGRADGGAAAAARQGAQQEMPMQARTQPRQGLYRLKAPLPGQSLASAPMDERRIRLLASS